MQLRTALAIAGLTLAATACGSDSEGTTDPGENPAQNSFSASITGQVSKSLSGQAAFAQDNTQQDVGFAMGFVVQGSSDVILLWREAPGVLSSGQHTVANYAEMDETEIPANQLASVVVLDANTASPMLCTSTGGSVNVTSSSSTRLRGSFNFTAVCVDAQGQGARTANIAGSFDAAGGGSVVIPG